MSLTTVVLMFFAVMEAGELRRRNRQYPYLAAGVLLTLLALARIYLGLEWMSGALMGITAGLAWTAVVGFAYRQRATRHFSGAMASMIFYASLLALFAWQVKEHTHDDLAALQSTTVIREVAADHWWASEWNRMPMDRTQLVSVASRRFNAQAAVDPMVIAEHLYEAGWEAVPETDWRWFLQALNPEPDEVTLPLLGRAYQGSPEALLLKKNIGSGDRILTIRFWDSGVRLIPGSQVLYLGQISEEVLVQRFGLYSYWRAVPVAHQLLTPIHETLAPLDLKQARPDLLLIR
jgi:undecaprenyl-diphosphatase